MIKLSFLLELFMDPECPCGMRDKLVKEIKEEEERLMSYQLTTSPRPIGVPLSQAQIRDEQRNVPHGTITVGNVVPIEHVAQTQMAAAAIASREKAIADSIAGKVDKDLGRPRKF